MTVTHVGGVMENIPNFVKVQGILIVCVMVFLIVAMILGLEKHETVFE